MRKTLVFGLVCFAATLGVALGATSALGATGTRAEPGIPVKPLNIVLISLDTTRADHTSLLGYPLPTTTNLDRFARDALVFENARTVVPLTGPSHASVFTGLYPHRHGAFRNGVRLQENRVTLTEILRAHGYDTRAFISGWTLRGKLCGQNQGFLSYDDSLASRYKVVNRERLAEDTVAAVKASLDRQPPQSPFFLFVHLFDPHAPYRRHPGIYQFLELEARALPPERRDPKVLAYDNELAYMDLHLGALLELLRLKGLLDQTAVLIFADHGESLGEHDYWGHGRRVFEQTLRVPVVLRAPGWFPQGRRIPDPVSTLDLLPTLLSLAGIPLPPGMDVEGRDLAGRLLAGEPLPAAKFYFETFKGTLKRFTKFFARGVPRRPSYLGCVDGQLKFILKPDSSSLEVYDLGSDPAERQDLSGRWAENNPAPSLTAWYEQGLNRESNRTVLTREEIEQLKSLGYVE